MKALINSLKKLNISEEEIIIYITILELNTCTVLQLAQLTNIPRTTVYLLIESLINRNFIREIEEGKKKKYKANSPDQIIIYAKKQQEDIVRTIDSLENDIPQLKAIYGSANGQPKLRFTQGVKELQRLLNESLNAEQVYFWHLSEDGKEISYEIFEKYICEISKRMTHSIEFVLDDVEGLSHKNQHSTARNKIITIDQKYKTDNDFILFGDTFIYITYKNMIPQCTVISDATLAYFERAKLLFIIDNLSSHEN